MKKTIAICLMPLFAAGLFAQGPRGGFGRGPGDNMLGAGPGPRALVTGAPYSATETVTSQQTLAGGNQISRTHQTTVARDSQGRISTIETITPASGKAPYTIQTIFDPVAGYRYVLDSSTMIARQEPLPKLRPGSGAPPARPARPTRPNETVMELGTKIHPVAGIAATGRQTTESIPAGAIGNAQAINVVRETWVSTTLQIPVQIKTSDPRFGTNEMQLTNVIQGEPSATLFVVPSGYTIKPGGGRGLRGGGPGGPGREWKGGPPQQ